MNEEHLSLLARMASGVSWCAHKDKLKGMWTFEEYYYLVDEKYLEWSEEAARYILSAKGRKRLEEQP